MQTQEETNLAAIVQQQAEQIADLKDAISETCELLGHSGDDGTDLRDAVGQIVRLLDDQDRDGVPLTGLAAKLRQRLFFPSDLQLAALVHFRTAADGRSVTFHVQSSFANALAKRNNLPNCCPK